MTDLWHSDGCFRDVSGDDALPYVPFPSINPGKEWVKILIEQERRGEGRRGEKKMMEGGREGTRRGRVGMRAE